MIKMNLVSDVAGSGPFRQRLTSAQHNFHLGSWEITSADLGCRGGVPWSVRQFPLHGGRQEGVHLIVVDNGRMRITLIPTRGLSVLKVETSDLRLGWDSPVQEVVHPQFMNLPSRNGLGWLEGFNEWLVRCGLEFAGGPGQDKFITNTGAEASMDLTLHGRIGNIPASEVEVIIERKPPGRIRVRGVVHERMMFGPKLELQAELSIVPGEDAFRIEDVVTNRAGHDQEFDLFYHVNYGTPLLGEGARLVGAFRRVTPYNAVAVKDARAYDRYQGPTPGSIEACHFLYPYADARKRTAVMLQNGAADRAVLMEYSVAQMPYLTQWKCAGAISDGYVTGIEPGICFPNNRRIEREAGRLPKLKPGESRPFALDFSILQGASAVRTGARRIQAIRRGRKPQIDDQPYV